MSLRAKFLALFAALAVAPLIAIGIFDYLHSMRALEALVATQVGAIAERAARELADQYALRESDLLLLAENAETQRLYRAHANGDAAERRRALSAADEYLSRAWQQFATSYARIEFRDRAGSVLHRLGEQGAGTAPAEPVGSASPADLLRVVRPIRDLQGQQEMGALVAWIRLDALLPREALETRFGRAGYSVVLDRSTGRVLFHPRHAYRRQNLARLVGPDGWNVDAVVLEQGRGTIVYRETDSTRVASFTSLTTPPWTVLASGATDEFAAPFARMRLINLVLVLLVTAAIAAAFTLLTRRATGSLQALTAAADEVGMGNFAPGLPPSGHDEVGRLSAAFGLMVEKVREMLRQIEVSRHMAAIGEFASQLSHEIRNPLTSLKLNLQSLDRDVQSGRISSDSARPISICLREIQRLDRVARDVLKLGRPRSTARVPCSIHTVLTDTLEVVRAELDRRRVAVESVFRAPQDVVQGDAEQLKAMFLNLFLNGAEAMPDGGKLRVSTEQTGDGVGGQPGIRVRVADDGPGIPPETRDAIFQPFYSTKDEGTGFGLPLALRTVEEHGGRLALEKRPLTDRGAEFVVELPLAAEESQA